MYFNEQINHWIKCGIGTEWMQGYGSLLMWLSPPLLCFLLLSLSSVHSLSSSSQAQCKASRIDWASSCPLVEMIGFGTGARVGWGSWLAFGQWKLDACFAGACVSRPHSGLRWGSRVIRINITTGELVELAQHALQENPQIGVGLCCHGSSGWCFTDWQC